MIDKALSDTRIIDLTHCIAGPFCTKLLADFGAEVIKVERAGVGDRARDMGPFLRDEPHPEKSGLFLYLNTSKKSITLNLKSKTGVKVFKDYRDISKESYDLSLFAYLKQKEERLKSWKSTPVRYKWTFIVFVSGLIIMFIGNARLLQGVDTARRDDEG